MQLDELYVGKRVICKDVMDALKTKNVKGVEALLDNYVVTSISKGVVSCEAVVKKQAFNNECTSPVNWMHYGVNDLHLLEESKVA